MNRSCVCIRNIWQAFISTVASHSFDRVRCLHKSSHIRPRSSPGPGTHKSKSVSARALAAASPRHPHDREQQQVPGAQRPCSDPFTRVPSVPRHQCLPIQTNRQRWTSYMNGHQKTCSLLKGRLMKPKMKSEIPNYGKLALNWPISWDRKFKSSCHL